VSADPSLHEESFRGAKFLLRLLEGIGCEVKLAQVCRRCASRMSFMLPACLPACLQPRKSALPYSTIRN
jgi:hypothetical protein